MGHLAEHGCWDGITRTDISVAGEVSATSASLNWQCGAWNNHWVRSVRFRCSAHQMMVGLTAQTTSASSHESNIDYAVHCEAGTFTVNEGGSRISSHGAYASSDVLEVRYTATGSVEYIRDGTVVASRHKGVVGHLHVALSFSDGVPAAVTAIEVQSAHAAATNIRSALSTSAWSTRWDNTDFTHVMFASGDCRKWVVMTTIHALEWIQSPNETDPTLRQATSSSRNSDPHTIKALKRSQHVDDPIVYLGTNDSVATCALGDFMSTWAASCRAMIVCVGGEVMETP